jgi:hypothetical protein
MPLCTSCTHPVDHLYTVYSKHNVRLEQCVSYMGMFICHALTDLFRRIIVINLRTNTLNTVYNPVSYPLLLFMNQPGISRLAHDHVGFNIAEAKRISSSSLQQGLLAPFRRTSPSAQGKGQYQIPRLSGPGRYRVQHTFFQPIEVKNQARWQATFTLGLASVTLDACEALMQLLMLTFFSQFPSDIRWSHRCKSQNETALVRS